MLLPLRGFSNCKHASMLELKIRKVDEFVSSMLPVQCLQICAYWSSPINQRHWEWRVTSTFLIFCKCMHMIFNHLQYILFQCILAVLYNFFVNRLVSVFFWMNICFPTIEEWIVIGHSSWRSTLCSWLFSMVHDLLAHIGSQVCV